MRGADPGWIRGLLRRARDPEPGDRVLGGRTIATLFFENSTRTKTSFMLAARRLGADVVDASGTSTSVAKGESLVDTALTVAAMGVDAIVMRHASAGAAGLVARHVGCPVVNAGDGKHEHPTQGLLDALALAESQGRADDLDLTGLRVLICGDIANSRVARSSSAAITALGGRVVLCGPVAFLPASAGAFGPAVTVSRDFDAELARCDAVMMLRTQFERHGGPPRVSRRAFRAGFALTRDRVGLLRPHAVIMHPGPWNLGIEIDAGAAGHARCIARRQVALGVSVRAAVLAELLSLGSDGDGGGTPARGVASSGLAGVVA